MVMQGPRFRVAIYIYICMLHIYILYVDRVMYSGFGVPGTNVDEFRPRGFGLQEELTALPAISPRHPPCRTQIVAS